MNGLPYYKAYPRDFIEGTIGMCFETKAAYRLVLDLIYMQGGALPDDARYISGQLGCSVKKWNNLRSALIQTGKIEVRGEFLGNDRADKELETLGKFQDKQRENRARPNKNKVVKSPRFDHTEPDTDTEETIGKPIVERTSAPPRDPEQPKPKPAPRGASRGSRIPPNWAPQPQDYAFASSQGMSPKEINDEADKFRDYWTAKSGRDAAKIDWSATWRNWVRSDFRKPSKSADPTRVNAPRGAFDRVISRLDEGASGAPEAGRTDYGSDDGSTIDGVFSTVPESPSTGPDWLSGGSDQADAGALFGQRRAGHRG